MNERYVTYRIGANKEHPLKKRNGTEIDERTPLGQEDFVIETEKALGKKISIFWFGAVEMPSDGGWLV